MAANNDWQDREVAATAFVGISRKKVDEVIKEMVGWTYDANPNDTLILFTTHSFEVHGL